MPELNPSNGDDFLIRRAENSDAEAIAAVNINTWKGTYKNIVGQDFLDGLNVNDKIPGARKRIGRNDLDCFVAVEKSTNKLIGFSDFGPCREKNVDADAELYAIYIYEEFQGFGIGKRLFSNGYESTQKRGYKKMMVSVFDQNLSAKIFYEKMGGRLEGADCVVLNGVRYPTATYVWNF